MCTPTPHQCRHIMLTERTVQLSLCRPRVRSLRKSTSPVLPAASELVLQYIRDARCSLASARCSLTTMRRSRSASTASSVPNLATASASSSSSLYSFIGYPVFRARGLGLSRGDSASSCAAAQHNNKSGIEALAKTWREAASTLQCNRRVCYNVLCSKAGTQQELMSRGKQSGNSSRLCLSSTTQP